MCDVMNNDGGGGNNRLNQKYMNIFYTSHKPYFK